MRTMRAILTALCALAALVLAEPSFADGPKLWVDADARLANYHAVYIAPVLTDTGQPAASEYDRDLRGRIRSGLASTKLPPVEAEKGPGVVKS